MDDCSDNFIVLCTTDLGVYQKYICNMFRDILYKKNNICPCILLKYYIVFYIEKVT